MKKDWEIIIFNKLIYIYNFNTFKFYIIFKL